MLTEQDALELQLEAYRFAQRPDVQDLDAWQRALGHTLGRGYREQASELELADAWAWTQDLWQFPLVLLGPEIDPLIRANVSRFAGLFLHAEDVPLRDGVCLLQTPLDSVADFGPNYLAQGFAWQLADVPIGQNRSRPGVELVWLSDVLIPDLGTARLLFGTQLPVEPMEVKPSDSTEAVQRGVLPVLAMAVWTMMRDYVQTQPAVPRSARRRAARAGAPEPAPVRWVTLRRRRSSSTAKGTQDVHWQHQWLVSGHWRNQWYPSIQAHRPRWIAAYLKGPEGAPMLERETDYRLVR
jgi:hypothetical protein